MLKIAGVKSEKDFYKKFPTEESFMAKHGAKLKKAAMGKSMVDKQLHQLTEWEGVPKAYGGIDIGIGMNTPKQNFNKYLQVTNQFGLNPDGTLRTVGDSFNNAAIAKYSGQQAASNMASEYATPSADQLLGKNAINSGAAAKGTDWAGIGTAAIGALPGIISGVGAIQQQATDIAKADRASRLATLANEAAGKREKVKRKYVRPEDFLVQPGQLGNPYGSGTNYLAKNGKMIGGNPTEIQNIYNPGDIYTDGGYEPIESKNLKQYKQGGDLPKAELGEYFQDSGQAQIGSSVGTAAGTLLGGPLGGIVGGMLGKVVGNLFGGADDARRLKRFQDEASSQSSQAAWQGTMQNQFGAYLKDGGNVGDEYKWVSNTWQPQVIAKFGDYDVKDLLKPPHDADMLRSGGPLAQVHYTPPSAEAMFTGRPDMPHAQFGFAMGAVNKDLINIVQNSEQANKLKSAVSSGMFDNGGRMTSTNMMFDTDRYPAAKFGKESNMSGDLEVIDGGKAETISYNPFLPDGGETVMFKGRSHDNGGIPINFGENGVEVEGGEPAVKLQDGGKENNMVVFGNIKINKNIANLMGDPKAKDMKFKTYIADVAKNDAKQQKKISKATDIINNASNNSKSGHLAMITGKLMKDGAEQWQKINAEKIKQAGIVQNAILDTASELGVKSDELAEGKIEKEKDPRMMAKYGKKLKKAQSGDYEVLGPQFDSFDYTEVEPVTYVPTSSNITGIDIFGNYTGPQEPFVSVENTGAGFGKKALGALSKGTEAVGGALKKYGPALLSNIAPWLRPSNANEMLPPDQLYPEYLALATNQLEPVQAQTYQPMLDTPMDISLNDQLNAVDAQSRAAIRAAGNNPAAQAMIMAQSLEAKNKVLGEQTRINAANKMETYNRNRAALNDAQLKNLQILDQQYVRQAQAKSNTKEQALAAVSSIAAKTAQQRAANRKLAVLENMYGFRFSPSGRAINMNAPAQFNLFGNPSATKNRGLAPDMAFTYDESGNIVGTRKVPKSSNPSMDEIDDAFQKNGGKTSKKNTRNSSIVKALKNL